MFSRKDILFFLIAAITFSPLVLPAIVSAQGAESQPAVRSELRSLINELRTIREKLNEILAKLAGKGSLTDSEQNQAKDVAASIRRIVSVMDQTYTPGDKGQDVLDLQRFLNENPYTRIVPVGPSSSIQPNTPGNETGVYDKATREALRRYREILSVVSVADLINKYKAGQLGGVTFLDAVKGLAEKIFGLNIAYAEPGDVGWEVAHGDQTLLSSSTPASPTAGEQFGGKITEYCGPEKCKYIQNGSDCSQQNTIFTSFVIANPPGKSEPYVTHEKGRSTGKQADGKTDPSACTPTPAANVNFVGTVNARPIMLNTGRNERTKECTGKTYGPGKVITYCTNVEQPKNGNTQNNQNKTPVPGAPGSNESNFGNSCGNKAGSSCPSCGGANGSKNIENILTKLLSSSAQSLIRGLISGSGSGSGNSSGGGSGSQISFEDLVSQAFSGTLTQISGPEKGAVAIFDRPTNSASYEPGIVGVCLNNSCSLIIVADYKTNKYKRVSAPTGREVTYFRSPNKSS